MTQSKQEVAQRNARIRAEKLRENLSRRKQQLRQRAVEKNDEKIEKDIVSTNIPDENSVG